MSHETAISRFFDGMSDSMNSQQVKNGVPSSAQYQVDAVERQGCQTILDVGSGPGNIMLEYLNHGVQEATGIDLSPKMNEVARHRLQEAGFDEAHAKIIDGSFLEIQPGTVEAVSFHRVLCCNPQRTEMLEKAASYQPQVITLTVPRDWIFLRVIVGAMGWIATKFHRFRPYVHRQSVIDAELTGQGYKLVERKKGKMWTTSTYTKK